jgi:hypothetical protein
MQKNSIKKIGTIGVIILGLAVILYVGFRVLYPKNKFDSTKTNNTVNTIIFPSEKRGYLIADPVLNYDFYSAKIEVFPKNISPKEKKIKVEKGFIAQLYPQGAEIETTEELKKYIFSDNPEIPNGKLVSANDAVYIYSRGKWRPFLGPEFFGDLKLDWDRVEPLADSFKDSFEQGERIIATTPHPDGTMFKTKDDKFFLAWEERLLPIKNEKIIKEVWDNYFVVPMDSQEGTEIGECEQAYFAGNFKCSFLESYTKGDISGNTFIFSFGEDADKIKNAKISLDPLNFRDLKNPKITLASLKAKIIEKYGEEIFK